jgi:hypothetical protein
VGVRRHRYRLLGRMPSPVFPCAEEQVEAVAGDLVAAGELAGARRFVHLVEGRMDRFAAASG